jgi:hypothetical protein
MQNFQFELYAAFQEPAGDLLTRKPVVSAKLPLATPIPPSDQPHRFSVDGGGRRHRVDGPAEACAGMQPVSFVLSSCLANAAQAQMVGRLPVLFITQKPLDRQAVRRWWLSDTILKQLEESEAHAWSRTFIENSRLGYRINIPPQNLRLDPLDADPSSTNWTDPSLNLRDREGINRRSAGYRSPCGSQLQEIDAAVFDSTNEVAT